MKLILNNISTDTIIQNIFGPAFLNMAGWRQKDFDGFELYNATVDLDLHVDFLYIKSPGRIPSLNTGDSHNIRSSHKRENRLKSGPAPSLLS